MGWTEYQAPLTQGMVNTVSQFQVPNSCGLGKIVF